MRSSNFSKININIRNTTSSGNEVGSQPQDEGFESFETFERWKIMKSIFEMNFDSSLNNVEEYNYFCIIQKYTIGS